MAVEMKQLPLPIAPPPASGFDHLVVGGNAAAVQHLHGLCTATGAQPPVYLWGDAGTGKTHLMRALVAQRQADGEQAGWFDASAPLPWVLDETWRLVVVDRCDALDADHQQAAECTAQLALCCLKLLERLGVVHQLGRGLDAGGLGPGLHHLGERFLLKIGFTFDGGPTVITDPPCLEELWALSGHKMSDDVELMPVFPFYRLNWPDGTNFDYSNDAPGLKAEIENMRSELAEQATQAMCRLAQACHVSRRHGALDLGERGHGILLTRG
jgi:hypothetical protein